MTARFAVLVSEFKLTPRDIYDLTPRQIEEVYFHARDKDGAIVGPSALQPTDPLAKLTALLGLAQSGVVKLQPDDLAKLRARIEAAQRGDQPGQV